MQAENRALILEEQIPARDSLHVVIIVQIIRLPMCHQLQDLEVLQDVEAYNLLLEELVLGLEVPPGPLA